MSESNRAINPNQADLAELILLPGVGNALAERIIERRPFDSVDDMQRVPGLGAKTLARLEPMIHFIDGDAGAASGRTEAGSQRVNDAALFEADDQEKSTASSRVSSRGSAEFTTRSQALGISAAAAGVAVVVSILLILSILIGINRTLNVSRHAAVRDLTISVNVLQDQLGGVESDIGSIDQRLAALEGLSGRMTDLENETADLETDVQSALTQVQRMRNSVDEISLQIDELSRQAENQATFFERLQELLIELFGGPRQESVQ